MNATNKTEKELAAKALSRFVRECRVTRDHRNRMVKAYRVPGTPEAGRYAMLKRYAA